MFFPALNYWDVFLGDISFYLVLEVFSSFSSRSYPPCPKTYRSLRYEYDYQHGIKNPNTVLLVRPNVRKCNERLAVNMINKKCITFPDRVASTVLLLLCETSCPPQQQDQGLPAAVPGLGTTDVKLHRCCWWCCSPVLLLSLIHI